MAQWGLWEHRQELEVGLHYMGSLRSMRWVTVSYALLLTKISMAICWFLLCSWCLRMMMPGLSSWGEAGRQWPASITTGTMGIDGVGGDGLRL
jgi:hypothetical protein